MLPFLNEVGMNGNITLLEYLKEGYDMDLWTCERNLPRISKKTTFVRSARMSSSRHPHSNPKWTLLLLLFQKKFVSRNVPEKEYTCLKMTYKKRAKIRHIYLITFTARLRKHLEGDLF